MIIRPCSITCFLTKPRRISFFMKKKICFFSFLLPFLSMMAIFIGNGIYPFGDQSFMHSDMYHQYMPFLSEFVHKIFTAITAQARSTG